MTWNRQFTELLSLCEEHDKLSNKQSGFQSKFAHTQESRWDKKNNEKVLECYNLWKLNGNTPHSEALISNTILNGSNKTNGSSITIP